MSGAPGASGSIFPPPLTVMPFDSDQLRRIAALARIRVDSAELDALGRDMAGILALIDQLQAVDTAGVDPLTHPLSAVEDIALSCREDRADEPDRHEAALALAPQAEEGLFLVPRVIE